MCGIFSSVFKGCHCLTNQNANIEKCDLDPHLFPCENIKKYLARRGPDHIQEINIKLTDDWNACFVGSVLWTQGTQLNKQPIRDEHDNILLWNGDVLYGPLETSSQSDTESVFSACKVDVLSAVVNIGGPFSFVFWSAEKQHLWFGRDVMGRVSLLWDVSPHHIILTSVAHKHSQFKEVPALGVFKVDLSCEDEMGIHFFPWAHQTSELFTLSNVSVIKKQFLEHCTLRDGSNRCSWLGKEPTENELFLCHNTMEYFLQDPAIITRIEELLDVLTSAVACRVKKHPEICKDCMENKKYCLQKCEHCNVAILFSGGLDSTILALLTHKLLPETNPIDLYNVAFQQKNKDYDVPDRITGRASLQELRALTPGRVWNFVEINVTREELSSQRKAIIGDLIHPLISVLDDSLGCALWFAAKGEGQVDGQFYKSPARVILLGMGADEQMGGYTRHRNTLRHSKQWASLGHQLVSDTDNIARRNMGRDNRVTCDHGRQPRTPFLDERVVSYINSLAPWYRCMPVNSMPPGLGDKLLLRLLAYRLGLSTTASLPKRALQFGSRIANPREKADQVSQQL